MTDATNKDWSAQLSTILGKVAVASAECQDVLSEVEVAPSVAYSSLDAELLALLNAHSFAQSLAEGDRMDILKFKIKDSLDSNATLEAEFAEIDDDFEKLKKQIFLLLDSNANLEAELAAAKSNAERKDKMISELSAQVEKLAHDGEIVRKQILLLGSELSMERQARLAAETELQRQKPDDNRGDSDLIAVPCHTRLSIPRILLIMWTWKITEKGDGISKEERLAKNRCTRRSFRVRFPCPSEVEIDNRTDLGMKVAKYFDSEEIEGELVLHFGRVTKFYPREQKNDSDYWRVVYEDGDAEDFDYDELKFHHTLFLKKRNQFSR